MGSSKLKSLARGHIWWPGLDKEIKNLGKACPSTLQSNKLHLGLHFNLGFGHLDHGKDYTSNIPAIYEQTFLPRTRSASGVFVDEKNI